jgi:uncharacterized protein YndB with AHSA1/START domain
MTVLSHTLNRTIVIRASREIVFAFFCDSARWAAWWGAGSTIDARPGGEMRIRYPDGTEAAGEVLEVSSPQRIVFTYGYVKGTPIPPGASRVTIRLDPHADGTALTLTHEFADEQVRDQHVQGWRYQLSLFANLVANEVNAHATDVVDAWFLAWTTKDAAERETALSKIAEPSVAVRDRFTAVDGIADLQAHITGAQRFMPGLRLRRAGDIRHCQGTVLAEWVATAQDGQQRGSGTNVFSFGPDGRLASVVGFWN